MTSNKVPPLLAPTLVFRSRTEFLGLPHVTDAVSELLDTSASFTPLEACKLGFVTLLGRIWNSSAGFDSNITGNAWLRKFLRTDRHYQQYVFSSGLEDAVPRKNLELVQWFLTTFQGLTVSSEVVARACLAGSMEILELIYENDTRVLEQKGVTGVGHRVEWGNFPMSAAIQNRRSDIVWWLHRHIPDANYNLNVALRSALDTGNVLMAEWLVSQGAGWPERRGERVAAHKVAGQGRVDVLEWLDDRGQLDGVMGMVVKAAEKGRLDAVKWLIERGSSIEGREIDAILLQCEAHRAVHGAAINGHLEVAKYLREYVNSSLNYLRVYQKQLPVLQESLMLLRNAEAVGASTMAKAASNGHLDVVKWLYAEYANEPNVDLFASEEPDASRRSFTDTAMDAAASCGHLDVLQYLHQLQISLDESANKRKRDDNTPKSRPKCSEMAMSGAAFNGHLEVVEWLHQNRKEGRPTEALDYAASKGHLKVVQWLHEQGAQGTKLAMNRAALNGHLEVVKWLHANTQAGCTAQAMNGAATNGHLEVVKWLHEHRTEGCTAAAMNGAAGRGALDVVKWLHENRAEGCTAKAMDGAAEAGHFRVAEWLHKHRTEGCTTSATVDAAASNHFEVFLFLHTQLQQECTEEVAFWSQENESREINAWICEHHPEFQDMEVEEE